MGTREQFGLALFRNPAVELDQIAEPAIRDVMFEFRLVFGIARADDVEDAVGNDIVNTGEYVNRLFYELRGSEATNHDQSERPGFWPQFLNHRTRDRHRNHADTGARYSELDEFRAGRLRNGDCACGSVCLQI